MASGEENGKRTDRAQKESRRFFSDPSVRAVCRVVLVIAVAALLGIALHVMTGSKPTPAVACIPPERCPP